jgi:Na+/melibiose symporter-like transporter
MASGKRGRERCWQLLGWLLFVLCALLFIAASIRSGDGLALAASLVFLLACVCFIVPLIRGG